MSSLKLFRNTARQTLVAAAARVSPFSNAAVRRNVAPALWARSFASGGGFLPKEEVLERVSVVVKNFQNVDPAKVTATSHFMNDLGLDSLDTVEMVMAFEDEFAIEIPDAEAEKIQTVAQAVEYLSAHPQAK
mmetsp:Transcript_38451/g.87689  ORF Transcript_38451/g.87689 Transcript_38451/m.87689 type:complete len:132 (-) Transcript_38451:107-502(-)